MPFPGGILADAAENQRNSQTQTCLNSPRRLEPPRQRAARRSCGLRPRPEKCASPVSSLRLSTCSTLECPALRTVPSRASLLSTKNQNGLRNQFDATPYKPPTAQCESAQKIQNPKKSETTQQPKHQTKPAKPPNALSRTTHKNPKFTPDSNPENPKKTPVLTHPALSLSPHAPT